MADTVPYPDYHIGQWIFDVNQHRLRDQQQQVQLTPGQSQILLTLVKHFPDPVSSEQLLEEISTEPELTRNKLYQGIAKLRRVFNDSVHKATYIETVAKLGYRLTIAPELQQEIPQPEVSECSADDARGTLYEDVGSIDQDIFADLSFIDSKVDDYAVADNPILTTTASNSFENDGVTTDKSAVIEHKSDIEAELESQAIVAKDSSSRFWLAEPLHSVRRALLIACLVLVVIALFFWPAPEKELPPEQDYPTQLYFSDITFEVENKVTTQRLAIRAFSVVNDNIQWWLRQKIQHLPLLKTVASPEPESFPRLATHLTYGSKQLTIEQVYFASANSDGQRLTPHQLPYDGRISGAQIDAELIELLVGDLSIKLTSDSCALSQFNTTDTPVNLLQSSDCLAENHVAISQQMAALNFTKGPSGNKPGSANLLKLQELITSVKQKFPDHSLGYEASAQLAALSGDEAKAIEQYLNVIELNASRVDNFVRLAQLYRGQKSYEQSLRLLTNAISLNPTQESLYYWQARDLQKLGYYYRVKSLMEQHLALFSQLSDRLRFSHINYNTLLEFAKQKTVISAGDKDLSGLIATAHGIEPMPVSNIKQAIERAAEQIKAKQSPQNITNWRYVSLLVVDNQQALALDFIKQNNMAEINLEDMILMADQVFYLNHYARLLIASQQEKEARILLNALVDFFTTHPDAKQLFSTQLAESYALLGRNTQALEELARVIGNGWMPDVRYDIADLKNNPNLASLINQWQFRALVQLVENRQLLLRKISES